LIVFKNKTDFQDKTEIENETFEIKNPNFLEPKWKNVFEKYFYSNYQLDKIPMVVTSPIEMKNNKIKNLNLNPEIVVKPYKIQNKNIFVIRDDLLIGGTKQRGLFELLQLKDLENVTEFVYAGPVSGFAQIALSYCCNILNKKSTLFLAKQQNNYHKFTKKAISYNAEVHDVLPVNALLSKVQYKAKKYVNEQQKLGNNVEYIPFGFDFYNFEFLLTKQIEKAWNYIEIPHRLWLVIGSGLILKVLGKIFPTTYFLVIQVGKSVTEEIKREFSGRVTFFKAPEKFYEETKILPPYPSVKNYDAKLWRFVIRYGKNYDFVWNVGG
jgi:hypothetical protein